MGIPAIISLVITALSVMLFASLFRVHRIKCLIAAVLVYGILTLPRLLPGGMTWEEIAIFGVLLVLVVCMAFRGLILHYNDKSQ